MLRLLLIPLLMAVSGLVPGAVGAEPVVLLGLYPGGALQVETPKIQQVDSWLASTGRRFGIAGDFMDPEFVNPEWNVPAELNAAWNAGYIPFVNFPASHSAAAIANGAIDQAVNTWAFHFATWAKNNGGPLRRAFIAPLQEMNGSWVPYYVPGGSGGTYIAAYRRIRQLFNAELQGQGLPLNVISWVFAPNGWGAPGDEFERYYPGHGDADIVAFSSYNYGGCPEIQPWTHWETFDTMFRPLLDRMLAMAPGKPIFISQTGVLDRPVPGEPGDKDTWLFDSYTRLAAYPRLRGILYFNYSNQPGFPNCPNADYRLHIPGTTQWQGFKNAVANPNSNFAYWAPTSAQVAQIVFAPTPPLVFADVFPIHPFAAEDGEVDFGPWILKLYNSGISTGCDTNPLRFCPGDAVTRDQMAVFLLRAIHGSGYSPPSGGGQVFNDVPPGHPFKRWIEQLAAEGITSGCGSGNFCPANAVTRAEMAVFLLRSKHGAGYTPPAARGTVFSDVPASHPFAAWIEQLAAEGITGGCGGGMYCPNTSVTRQQMAVFLARTFNL